MRERDIAGITRRKRRSLTRPAKKAVPAVDLIGRDFTASTPGEKLVGDITFHPHRRGLALSGDLAEPGDPRDRRLLDGRPPPRVPGRRRPGHGCRPRSAQARMRHTLRLQIGVHIQRTPPGNKPVGPSTEHGPHRLLLRQRRRRELLRAAQGGDRHPPLAQPGHRPGREFRLHRDLLQPETPAEHPAWGYLTALEIPQRHEQGHALASYASSVQHHGGTSRCSINPSTDGIAPSSIHNKPSAACPYPNAIMPRTRRSPCSSNRDSHFHNALSPQGAEPGPGHQVTADALRQRLAQAKRQPDM
jgi:hypothetical protein